MSPVLPAFLESEETLNEFLVCFETGTWPKAAWNHAAHVAVAGCYLIECSEQDVSNRVRRGICHYNDCTGTINSDHSGYHETLTLFWLAIVKARLGEVPDGLSRAEVIRLLITELAPKRDLYREYYSFDVVRFVEARHTWIEPDLKVLP